MGVQVRWERRVTEPADDYKIFCGKSNENNKSGTGLFVHSRITSANKRVEFVSDRMSYVTLRDWLCDIVVMNLAFMFLLVTT
jgi:hypothetical protein